MHYKLVLILIGFVVIETRAAASEIPASTEYRMSDHDFVVKFGVARDQIAQAPPARLAPIPPFPSQMARAKESGSCDYVIRVDPNGSVSTVDLVAYSRKEFSSGKETVKTWCFKGTSRKEIYRLHLAYKASTDQLWVVAE